MVVVVGGTVLALGLALIVLPGPAFLVISAGSVILAIEFAWAKRWLRKTCEWLPGKRAPQPPPPCVLLSLATLPTQETMTALRKIKHSLRLAFGAVLLAIGLTLLTLFGLAAVAVPAALGILGIEWARARRGLGAARLFWLTTKPTSPRTDAAMPRANPESK